MSFPLPTADNQRDLLRAIVDAGAEDPFHGKAMGSAFCVVSISLIAVDRMFFENEHADLLRKLQVLSGK